jgi:hypothetical protein
MPRRMACNVHQTIEQTLESRRQTMKPATIIGIVLVIIGVIGFAIGGFSFTHEKQDAKIGPLNIEHKETSTVPIPPILSGIALVGGIALVIVGAKSR